jgi:hypothetical protein
MIEEAAFGGAVDHGADETELFHGALEFDGGCIGTLQRQRSEAGKAVGVARDRGGQMIVELARERDAIGAGQQIRTRAAVGQHLHGDAGLVHRFEPDLADLGQELQGIWRARGEITRPITAAADDVFGNARTKRGHREVLLKGDGTHRRFPSRLKYDPEKWMPVFGKDHV